MHVISPECKTARENKTNTAVIQNIKFTKIKKNINTSCQSSSSLG